MPNHKSCAKRVKTSELERVRNKAIRSHLRSVIKDIRNETNKEQAASKLVKVNTLLDKAVSSGLLHKNNAGRNKSRLSHHVRKLG